MFRKSCLLALICLIQSVAQAQLNRNALYLEYQRLDSLVEGAKADNMPVLVDYSRQMIDIAGQLQSDTLLLNANMLLGQGLHFLGLFDAALKVDYENLALAEKTNHCVYRIRSASLIGDVYQVMGNIEKSQEFLEKAKQYAIACGAYSDTIHLNYDLAFNIALMGDVKRGIRITEQNLDAAKRIGDEDYIHNGIDNMANLLAENGEYQRALEYEIQLLHRPELQENTMMQAQIFEHLGEIYFLLGDLDHAQQYQQQALKLSTQTHLNDWIYECYKLQSNIDEARGNYKSALKNQRIFQELKDSVYQAESAGKMAAMSSLYDLETKQKTISLLEKDRQIKAGQIRQQRILLVISLLLVVLVVFAIRFLNQRKTVKMQEAFARDLITAQENERQRISRELHDSVGQNILFVKNRLQRLAPEPDAQLLNSIDQALEEVRTIAKDLYPNQLEAYGLVSAVDALCELAQESSGVFISSDLQGIDGKLNREARINCYRIIQECINNALKHANATAIRVTSTAQPGLVELVVQDNGKGLDKSLLERKSARSFGIINMEERVKMMRGTFAMETAANKGVKFIFSIPV